MRSASLPERILALQRLVFEDPTLDRLPAPGKYREAIAEIEDGLAELIAQRTVEDDDRAQGQREDGGAPPGVSARPQARGAQGRRRPRDAGDAAAARRPRRARRNASWRASALHVLRPAKLGEVVGQDAGDPLAAREDLVAVSAARHPLRAARRRQDDRRAARAEVAKTRSYTPFAADAPFVEASGATLRWDPRETTNPLLGSVHDPIYQGSRRDFAESGIPEPKLGLVTKAHGGVLFIDEIGEMDPLLQTKLLKVLEDKRVVFESSYYDPDDPSVPAYVKRLFAEGAPADFILIGATTREPERHRSRRSARAAPRSSSSRSPKRKFARSSTGAAKRLGARVTQGACRHDRVVHDRGPQGRADPRRRVRARALPACGRAKPRVRDQRGRRSSTSCRRAGSFRTRRCARARAARSARRSASASRTTSAASSRSKRRRSRRRAAQGRRALQRDRRLDGARQRLQRRLGVRALTGIDPARLRPARQRRRRRQHRRTVGRSRDLPRALLRADAHAAAAGRRHHGRTVDRRQGASGRRHRREAVRGAAGRHARSCSSRVRTRARCGRTHGVLDVIPVQSVDDALDGAAACERAGRAADARRAR